MSLLTPIFLLGLLGIALPIWLHRLQTQTTEREQFASTMFLEPSKKRIHVQRKLKYLLLMALRILFLVLLTLAFARPILFTPPETMVMEGNTHHVILLDTSFSMQAGDRFDNALEEAADIINAMENGDAGSLYLAGATITPLIENSQDKSALQQALQGATVSEGRLEYGTLMNALPTLVDAIPGMLQLHLISDFQKSAQAPRFADMIPDAFTDGPMALNTIITGNEALENWIIESVTVGNENQINVIVRVFGQANDIDTLGLTLSVNDEIRQQKEFEVSIAPNSIQQFSLDVVEFEEGFNAIEVSLQVDDVFQSDNRYFASFDNSPPAPVPLLTADPEALAVTYMKSALQTAPRGYDVQVMDMTQIDPRVIQRYPWLVVDDLGSIDNNMANNLTEYLQNGGSIIASLGEKSQNLGILPITGHTVDGGLNTLSRRSATSVDFINSSHPVLQGTVGWNTLNINSALPLQPAPEDTVLLALTDDTPFILESNVGRGKVILLNSALDNSDTDFPIKPVFVSFNALAARYLSRENVIEYQQTINEYLNLGQEGALSGQVIDPQGNNLLSLQDTTRNQSIQMNKTGIYQVITTGGTVLIGVNPNPLESDLAPMETQVIQNWQNSVATLSGSRQNAVTGNEVIQSSDDAIQLWKFVLILLTLVVLAESLLSDRYLRFNTGIS